MPHLVVLYTPNLEADCDLTALCRSLADAMLAVRDDDGRQVFPTGGTRVLAYPAAHFAVADGRRDYAFVYLNLRMGRGRTAPTQQRAGDALMAAARAHLDPVIARRPLGVTVNVDESPSQVYDAKHGSIHPLFGA